MCLVDKPLWPPLPFPSPPASDYQSQAEVDNARMAEVADLLAAEPDLGHGSFLLHRETYAALHRIEAHDADWFRLSCNTHKDAIELHVAPSLLKIAEGGPPSPGTMAVLADILAVDPFHAAMSAALPTTEPLANARAHVESLQQVWPAFRDWWMEHFGVTDAAEVRIVDLWQFFLSFSDWILRERESQRPGGLFIVGFNGSPGAGKTVMTSALTVVLNARLDPIEDGRAIARSGDDWYLSKADREPLRALGFDPGRPGISNRAPPGTQDRPRLERNLAELEVSTPDSRVRLANFDKLADDIPKGDAATVPIDGRVAVFLFDLWFAGARTDLDPSRQSGLLRQNIAAELRNWEAIFDRLDALVAFNWPSIENMLEEREAQEQLTALKSGKRGARPEDIECFMDYMIRKCWDWNELSPLPVDRRISFRVWRDNNHRIIAIERGGI